MADVAPAFISSAQGDWLLDASSRQSSANVTQALRLDGSPDLAALRKSVETLITTYESYWNLSGETHDASSDVLPIRDFSSLPIDTRENEARRYIHQQADRSFEVTRGPLLRATLARLSASESILLISMHRSLCGAGILIANVVAELSVLYNAAVSTQLSPLLRSVKPKVASTRGGLTTIGNLDYKQTAENTAAVLELPLDHLRSSQPRGIFGRQSHMLPKTLMASVREFSETQHLESFTTLAAAFAALLSRHTGQQQFFVGAPLTNLESRAEDVASGFPALSPWRADLSGEPSFRQLAQRVQRSSLQAALQAHQADGLRPTFHPFQVALIWEQPAWEAVHLAGLGVSPYEMETRSTGLELVLHLEEQPAGLLMTADYDAGLFDPGTIQRLLGHYETLLVSALSDPDGSVSQLAILTEPEHQRILHEWNATAREYPTDVPLQQLIEAQVDRTPDAVAVTFATASSSQERLTYRQLNARANQLAAHLRSLGVTRNTLVGFCLERSIDLVLAPLAILKAGGAYLPLDPDHPDDRIGPIVENAGLQILIGRPDLAARIPNFSGKFVFLDWDALAHYPDANQPVEVAGTDLAYVIYTSGSTGQPKGVMIPRCALNNLLWSVRDWYKLGTGDVLLAITTIAFDIAGLELWLPLLVGARMIMIERETAVHGDLLQDVIHREGVTFLQCTPAFWKLLVDSGWQGKADLQAVCGGEAMPKDLARKLFPRVGCLWNMYGPTETTIWSTGYKFTGPDDPILIGRPLANTQAYILDEQLAPTPIGVPGELYLGGDGLADGYLRNPALTAARFVDDPFTKRPEGSRLYKTGDLARYRSDGSIECLGRNDDQIKLRGYRIEPEEIRAALTRSPAIRDAVAVLNTSPTGDSRIVAYLISRNGNRPGADELRTFLRQRLPEYMIPANFVFLESFPLNSNGKIDRRALPIPPVPFAGAAGSEPTDPIEEQLIGIYRSVLGVSDIGVNDDFFDLGGHSLTAAQLFREINVSFNLDLPLATLFHAPTVRRLGDLIRDAEDGQMSAPVVQIQPNGSQTPLYCIGEVSGEVIVFRRLAQELGPDQPLFGLQPFRLLGSHPTVQQLASAYIHELRLRGESRPFCLMGYSFGGLVAVEMARQLKRSGIAPPLVVLIDAGYPAGCRQNEPWSQKVRRYKYLWHAIGNGGGLRYLLARVKYGITRMAHRATTTVGVPLPARGVKDVTALQEMAAESYRIKSYSGPVYLFRAESQQEFLAGGDDLGWTGVLSNLVVAEVPGDHGTINTGSNLKILAGKLRECLNGRPLRA
jgi:amino acid adenylation domain-containing protein